MLNSYQNFIIIFYTYHAVPLVNLNLLNNLETVQEGDDIIIELQRTLATNTNTSILLTSVKTSRNIAQGKIQVLVHTDHNLIETAYALFDYHTSWC